MTTTDATPISRIGVLDVGSSAIRMVIAEVRPDGTLRQIENLSRGVLLGRDAFTMGSLSNESIRAACEAIRTFKRVLDNYKVTRYQAVATSAVRESTNSDTFIDRVLLATGVEVEIIEGQEENRLTYAAVRECMKDEPALVDGDALLVEVGGGSTDVALVQQWEPLHSDTYSIGSIRLNQVVAAITSGHTDRLRVLRRHVASGVANLERDIPLTRARHFIALGGDVRFVAGQLLRDSQGAIRVVPRDAFMAFCDEMGGYDVDHVVDRYRISYADAETLMPALVVYRELLALTEAQSVFVPPVSMRDGLLLSLARMEVGGADGDFAREIASSATGLGQRYLFDEPHARHVTQLALALFDQLTDEHGLGPRERIILEVAGLLHDIGLFVSPQAHHKHSLYLISASHIFGMRGQDIQVAANVARYHRRSVPKRAHVEYATLDRDARITVVKLAALLRVANALDKDHLQKIKRLRVVKEEHQWILDLEPDTDVTAERLALGRVGDLFEDTFGVPLVLRTTTRW